MEEKLELILQKVQSELKAPKGQFNSFGNYKYRSCEDILEAVKPVLAKYGCAITFNDEIVLVGERYYVKATATISNGSDFISVSAYAREEETKKGMDGSQITGASSSYARKYALNGLFAIDDTKDSDATNKHGKDDPEPSKDPLREDLLWKIKTLGGSLDAVAIYFKKSKNEITNDDLLKIIAKKESEAK